MSLTNAPYSYQMKSLWLIVVRSSSSSFKADEIYEIPTQIIVFKGFQQTFILVINVLYLRLREGDFSL